MERVHVASFESPYGRLWGLRTPKGLATLLLPRTNRARLDLGPSHLVAWRDRHLPGWQIYESKNQFRDLQRWLREYFAGEEPREAIPLDLYGTPFQLSVWKILQDIPYGTYTTYGSISRKLRRSASAARAVGTAVGSNPVGIVVPCHRVIGHDEKLVGFGGGLRMKQDLLRREGVLLL